MKKSYLPIAMLVVGMVTAVLTANKRELSEVVDAVEYASIGQLVTLEAGDADSYVWKVLPPTDNYKVIDGGKRLIFSATEEGNYLFICAMARGGKVSVVITTITVGQNNGNDDGRLNVKKWLPKNFNRSEAKRLAQSFRLVAESNPTSIQDLLERTKISTNAALNDNIDAWKPFLEKISVYCDNMNDPQLTDFINLWLEISKELSKV